MTARMTTVAVAILVALCGTDLIAQQNNVSTESTYSGTEFYVAFPPNYRDAAHQFMGLVISAEFSTNGTIVVPEVPLSPLEEITSFKSMPFSVEGGESIVIPIDRPVELIYPEPASHNGEASRRSVHVTSRAPVSVTAINARQGVSGGFPVLPVDKWGTHYVPLSLPSTPNNAEIASQFTITAAHDNTRVTVYPNADVSWWDVGDEIEFVLNSGESWLLQAETTPGTGGNMDLSGSTVLADKPVGVVAGHVRAALSTSPDQVFGLSTSASWHASMQLPTSAAAGEWGTEYVSIPMRASGDRFRIVSLEPDTDVEVSVYDNAGNFVGSQNISIPWKQQVVDVSAPGGLRLTGSAVWKSNRPIGITQLRMSDGNYPDPENSPSMVRLISTDAYTQNSFFGLPESIKGHPFEQFTMTLTARGSGNPFENILIDGERAASISGATILPVSDGFWALETTIAAGGHVIRATGDAEFSGRVRGHNGSENSVALEWELPHWNPKLQADVTPPRVVDWNETGSSSVSVDVTDRTSDYFSGVKDVMVHSSPGWESTSTYIPVNADLDASATLRVRDGVDPSGPLTLKLIDRDGNETTTEVHGGFCQKSAYPSLDTLRLFVGSATPNRQTSGTLTIDANPCGEEATVRFIEIDQAGVAAKHLASARLIGTSAPTTIPAHNSVAIEVTTKANLAGQYTEYANLNVVLNDHTYQIPVELRVDATTRVDEAGDGQRSNSLAITPHPVRERMTVELNDTMSGSTLFEVLNGVGERVALIDDQSLGGSSRVDLQFGEGGVPDLGSGYYVLRVTNGDSVFRTTFVVVR